MSNPPAFQIYPADFYMDTISWSSEDLGVYLRLLFCEWLNGPLDFNAKKLAKIGQISDKKWAKSWQIVGQKFAMNGNGKLINKRLEREREKQQLWREKSSLGGKKSAERRARVVQPPYQPNGQPKANSLFLSSSSSLKDKEQQIDYSHLQKNTDNLCKTLTGYFKDFNFYAWRQEQVNKQKHPEAIEECLSLLWKNRKTNKKGPRPYLTELMKIKGPNAFYDEALVEHEKRKKEELSYDGHIGSILKGMK